MNYFSKWDNIDRFLYYDFWHNSGHSESVPVRLETLKEIFYLFNNNDLDLYVAKSTVYEIVKNNQINESAYADSLRIKYKNTDVAIDILSKNGFEIIELTKAKLLVFKNNRIFQFYFSSNIIFNSFRSNHVYGEINMNYNLIELIVEDLIYKFKNIYNFFYRAFRRRYLFYRKKIITRIFCYRAKLKSKDLDNEFYLNYSSFLNLTIEPKNSINWIIRKNHLNIVTKNKKYRKIKKIIKYLNPNQIDKLVDKIVESDNTKIFTEPISHNKKFWNNGNNYFIYNVIFSFRKDVIPYQDANKFIDKNSEINLFSENYFKSLKSMTYEEIKKSNNSSVIEINNNSIVGGKHRAFAMIGWIIQGNEYIPFKAKLV